MSPGGPAEKCGMKRGSTQMSPTKVDHDRHSDGPVIVGICAHSPDLPGLLGFAAGEANSRGVDLVLVHGCSSIPTLTSMKPSVRLRHREVHWLKRLGMLAEIAEELLDPARHVDIRVHRGTGVQALVEASTSASLVVVQYRRDPPSPRVRTGSTCARVALAARAPVAVVSASEPSSPPWGNVVVGVGATASGSALSLAFQEAEFRRTGVLAVHSWRPRPSGLLVDGQTELEEYRRQFGSAHQAFVEHVRPWAEQYPRVPLRHRVFTLPPAESLLLEATRGQLLVIGRQRRGLGRPRFGYIARRCLAEAPCPVLVSGSRQRIELPDLTSSLI